MSDVYDWRAFEDYAHGVMERQQIPGMAVAVTREGEVCFQRGFGFRDREEGLKVSEDTVFGIASVTKSFTGVLILQLAREGLLSLTDPVVKHLPELAPRKDLSQAQVHHFLTHSSGLAPLPSLIGAMARSLEKDETMGDRWEEMKKVEPLDTPEELMSYIVASDLDPLGPPGTVFSYSNDCFALLGTIVERLTGRSFEAAVRERILEPLGMDSTTVDLEGAGLPEVTTLYTRKGTGAERETVRSPLWWESPAMEAAGFLRSSASDLLKYLEMLRGLGAGGEGRVLEVTDTLNMMTPQIEYFPGVGYGYGFRVQPDYRGFSLVEHSGGLKGVSSHVLLFPDAGVTAVALCNVDDAPTDTVALAGANVALRLPMGSRRHPRRDYQYPVEHLEKFVGVYHSTEGISPPARVVVDGDRLVIRREDQEDRVELMGPHTFQVFFRPEDEEGKPGRFLVDSQGHVYGALMGSRVIYRKPLDE